MRSRSGWPRTVHLDELFLRSHSLRGLCRCLRGGLGVAFFAAFAFSFAANSCLTVAVIAATSTL